MEQLTENERYIIQAIRSLEPFEKIIIEADKQGKPNQFLIQRSTAVMLTDSVPIFVKVYKMA